MHFFNSIAAASLLLLTYTATAFVPTRPSFGVVGNAHFMSAVADAPTDATTGVKVDKLRYV